MPKVPWPTGMILLGLLMTGCGATTITTTKPKPPRPIALCHIRGLLPDPSCTPGAINPSVTQATIRTTICVRGWTATVRPPVAYTNALKVKQIAAYGYADTTLAHYEEDHLIPLELGGAPRDPANLWPEPGNVPNPKDKIENLLRQRVCASQVSLADAQHAIATDWTVVQ